MHRDENACTARSDPSGCVNVDIFMQLLLHERQTMVSSGALGESPSLNQPTAAPPLASERGRFHRFWQVFWLTFLVVSLAYAWYCFYVPSNSIVWADDYATAQRQAAQSDKQMILFFTGKWCVPCRIMKRNVWSDDLVAARVNAKFVPVLIDVNDPETVGSLKQFDVRSTPKTMVVDPQGNVLRQNEGGMSKSEFLGLLESVSRDGSSDL